MPAAGQEVALDPQTHPHSSASQQHLRGINTISSKNCIGMLTALHLLMIFCYKEMKLIFRFVKHESLVGFAITVRTLVSSLLVL